MKKSLKLYVILVQAPRGLRSLRVQLQCCSVEVLRTAVRVQITFEYKVKRAPWIIPTVKSAPS